MTCQISEQDTFCVYRHRNVNLVLEPRVRLFTFRELRRTDGAQRVGCGSVLSQRGYPVSCRVRATRKPESPRSNVRLTS